MPASRRRRNRDTACWNGSAADGERSGIKTAGSPEENVGKRGICDDCLCKKIVFAKRKALKSFVVRISELFIFLENVLKMGCFLCLTFHRDKGETSYIKQPHICQLDFGDHRQGHEAEGHDRLYIPCYA